ncbi:MAG: aminoglycoside phosphotransferase family protein, partial [Thermomicrobiales bacterium]
MLLPDPGAITIPQTFLEEIDRLHGAPGHAWLATVPDTVRRLAESWSLRVSGPPRHGAHGLVIPVVRAQAPMALKLVPRDAVTDTEVAGLRAWDGHGCVQLLAVDEDAGALLMEWLDAGRDLTSLPIDRAVTEAGRLARHLAIPPSDPVSFPTSSDRAREIARTLADRWEAAGRPFAEAMLMRLQDHA